jgi:stage II sporulation protein M
VLALSRRTPWLDWWDAHRPYVLLVLASMLLGTLVGALALQALSGPTRLVLLELLKRFLNLVVRQVPEPAPILSAALADNLKVLGLLYLLGVSVAGLPLVVLAVFFRGFVLGFATGFFLGSLRGLGLAAALVAIVLPNLALLPAWLATGAGGLRFSWRLLSRGDAGGRRLAPELVQYTVVALASAGLVGVGSVVEALVAPVLMHWLGPWGI